MHTKLHSCAQGYATGPPDRYFDRRRQAPATKAGRNLRAPRRRQGIAALQSHANGRGGRGLPICVANATGRRPRRNRPRPRRSFSTVVVATMLNTKDLTVFSTLKTGLTADFTPCFCDRKNIPHQSKRKTGRTFQRLLQNPSGHFARAESRIQESDCDEFRAVSFFAV